MNMSWETSLVNIWYFFNVYIYKEFLYKWYAIKAHYFYFSQDNGLPSDFSSKIKHFQKKEKDVKN